MFKINQENINKIEPHNLEKSLDKFYKEIASPNNIIPALGVALTPISLWNPHIGILLQAFLSTINMGVNVFSRKKAEDRLILIIDTIYKIWKKQQAGETNYEAALICPELFRNALIFEDEERVKEHLTFIEALFSSGKMDFDNLTEVLRLISRLSCMEYKTLKLIPHVDTNWNGIFLIKEFKILRETQEDQLTAAFLSLINMNLVVRKLVIRLDGGPELGTINYKDELEYIRLSAYGQLFLKTLDDIKDKHENS